MSNPNVIIALTSKRGRSGKDTLVELLREEGFKIHRVAFGDVLKNRCAEVLAHDECARYRWNCHMHTNLKDAIFEELAINEIPDSEYKDWLVEPRTYEEHHEPRSPRWHLQQYGTGFRRNHKAEPNVWLKEGLKEIAKAPKDALVVVTDMRQENEYEALIGLGAHLVRLSRDWDIPAVDDVPLHATDIELESFYMDAYVVNRWGSARGMLPQLRKQGVIE